MAKRFNIGIDIDGVLAAFTDAARRDMKGMFAGRPADDLVQTTWAFESLGITAEEERVFWRYVDNTPNWWLSLRPLPNTNVLPELVRNHRCVFITNRKDGTGLPIERQAQIWLTQHFGIEDANVLISDNKGPVAAGLKLDYYIDDRPKNIVEVAASHPIGKTVLLRTTYNRDLETYVDGPISEVDSFNEFAKHIIKESYGRA